MDDLEPILQPTVADTRLIKGFASSLANSLDRQMRNAYRPEGRKKLRQFSSKELMELTGISASNLRLRHNEDPEFPKAEADARGHRSYSAETMDAIRRHMAKTAKNGDAYRPGRRKATDDMKVICAVNFKGGSSKTTSTIHLAQRFALRGYRVLAIDMDPQASLTTLFGYRPELEFSSGGTIYDALRYDSEQVPLKEVILKTYFHNLDLAPAGLMLSEYETTTAYALTQKIRPLFAERLVRQLFDERDNYDIVFIDCPPNLGFLTLTALAAATGLIVTVVPSMLDIASMSQFLRQTGELFETIEGHVGRPVKWDFIKFLLTRYEPSDGPQTQMAAYLRSILPGHVLTEPMLKSTAISDAGITQQTIYEVEPGDFVRKTLERAISSCNAVADEVEQLVQATWGRT